MSASSLKSLGAYALVLVGVASVVVLSALSLHPSRANATARSLTSPSASALGDASPSSYACTAFPASSAVADSLRQSQAQARTLLDGDNTGEAVARFRSIAAADSALPGIHLDLSTALLKVHQTESAKTAISAQLGISECLSKMPPTALDAYCKAQMSDSTPAGCRQALAAIERSAHFQSALVQMELANALGAKSATGSSPRSNASAAGAGARGNPGSLHQDDRKPNTRLLAATRSEPLAGKPRAAAAKPAAGNPLAAGAGTDAALGAYSK